MKLAEKALELLRLLLAVGLLVAGVSLIYPPAGFIAAGVILLVDIATDRFVARHR